jgi:hypothetical protein
VLRALVEPDLILCRKLVELRDQFRFWLPECRELSELASISVGKEAQPYIFRVPHRLLHKPEKPYSGRRRLRRRDIFVLVMAGYYRLYRHN